MGFSEVPRGEVPHDGISHKTPIVDVPSLEIAEAVLRGELKTGTSRTQSSETAEAILRGEPWTGTSRKQSGGVTESAFDRTATAEVPEHSLVRKEHDVVTDIEVTKIDVPLPRTQSMGYPGAPWFDNSPKTTVPDPIMPVESLADRLAAARVPEYSANDVSMKVPLPSTEPVETVAASEPAPTREAESPRPKEISSDDWRRRAFEATVSATVEDVVADLAKPEMKDSSLVWSDAPNPAELAEFLRSSQQLLHEQGIGPAVQAAFAPIAGDSAESLATFVSCYEIPGDRAFLWARRGAQCLGIVLGLVSGHPAMALVPLKSLIVDEAQRAVKHTVVQAITEPFRDRPASHRISAATSPQMSGPDIAELAELAKAFGLEHLVPGDSTRLSEAALRPRWIVVRNEVDFLR